MPDNVATREEILREIQKHDFEDLLFRMEAYASKLIGDRNLRCQPIDIVSDAIASIYDPDGGRVWNKGSHPEFGKFLASAVKSIVSNLWQKETNRSLIEKKIHNDRASLQQRNEIIEAVEVESIVKLLRAHVMSKDPDEIEEGLLECWIEDIRKPKEIATVLEVDVETINKATKRLRRKVVDFNHLA